MSTDPSLRTARSLAIAKAGLYIAAFMAVFDIAVVYLALPSLERGIGAGLADQQWIASAYGLSEAGFTLAAGTLGDLYGRRRIYILGIVVFILASIGSGLAPSPVFLIVARFIQGIGGAIAMALSLANLVALVEGEKATEAAIRTFATVAGLGAVTAPALGGLLVHLLGWRSIFFVNVPVALFVLYAAFAHTVESPRDRDKRLDLAGQLATVIGLVAFSFAVIEGAVLGWGSPPIVLAALLSIGCAAAFPAIEHRAASPMIRFSLLREPLLSAGAWNMLLMNVGFFTLYLLANLYVQDVRRVDALTTGWYLLANNLMFFLANQFGGPLLDRFGERGAAVAGTSLGAVGLVSLALLRADSPAALVMLPLFLCGTGWGIAFTPLNALAMSVVPKNETGLASAMLGLGRPLGAVFGTAVFGSVVAIAMKASLLKRLAALHVSPDTAGSIGVAVHHGGLWSLLGQATQYGLPTDTLTNAIDAGFITGTRLSAVIGGLALAGGVVYALVAYRVGRRAESKVPAG